MDAMRSLGRDHFGDGVGIVRLALRPGPDGRGRTHLVGETRPVGPEARRWRAVRFAEPHPGPGANAGIKCEGVALYARAGEAAARAGADDALLVDAAGYVVEGARTNLFIVRPDGVLVTPPLARGGVAGVAREVVLEQLAEAQEAEILARDLLHARELVLVNAVRGAVHVFVLDAQRLPGGAGTPWTDRMHELLLSDPGPAGPVRRR